MLVIAIYDREIISAKRLYHCVVWDNNPYTKKLECEDIKLTLCNNNEKGIHSSTVYI